MRLAAAGIAFFGTVAASAQTFSAIAATEPRGVSDTGVVVGRYYWGNANQSNSFVYSQTMGLQVTAPAGNDISQNEAVSDEGKVAVGWYNFYVASYGRATRWTQAGGTVSLPIVSGNYAYGFGVSGDGNTVVGNYYLPNNSWRAFRWTSAGGTVDLNTGVGSIAFGASKDGSVICGAAGHAFRWTQAGGAVDLGALGDSSSGRAISSDGTTVVGSNYYQATQISRAFMWTQAGGMVDLGDLGGPQTDVLSVNEDGHTAVGWSDGVLGMNRPCRWTVNGPQDIITKFGWMIPAGWQLYGANAMSSTGRYIVGAAIYNNQSYSYILDTVIEVQGYGFSLSPGNTVFGSFFDLGFDDGTELAMKPGPVFSNSQDPIALTITGQVPPPPVEANALHFVIRSRAGASNIRQIVEAFNYSTNSFQVVSTVSPMPIAPSDPERINLWPPADFISGSGEVKSRIRYKATAAVFVYPWIVYVDHAIWWFGN